jgi:hypothetical protein
MKNRKGFPYDSETKAAITIWLALHPLTFEARCRVLRFTMQHIIADIGHAIRRRTRKRRGRKAAR